MFGCFLLVWYGRWETQRERGRKGRVKERRGRAKKKSHVTARDVLDQWQKAPQAQPAAGVAIAEKGTHFPFIKTELASRFFRLLLLLRQLILLLLLRAPTPPRPPLGGGKVPKIKNPGGASRGRGQGVGVVSGVGEVLAGGPVWVSAWG
jgi:hypothetical protein